MDLGILLSWFLSRSSENFQACRFKINRMQPPLTRLDIVKPYRKGYKETRVFFERIPLSRGVFTPY